MQAMNWIPVEVALPEHGQAVLVRYARDNWLWKHTVAGGEKRTHWRWQAAMFVRGRTEERNNLRPYSWEEFGADSLFGQDVTHWAAISDPCAE